MTHSIRRLIALLTVTLIALSSLLAPDVAAQDDPVDGFPLPANTAFCEPGYFGPFEGCTPWEGVTVSYTSADGTFNESCITVAGERTASCSMQVPFGSSITASIDPSVIPAGYVLEGAASLSFEIPDGPPEGLFGGPSFVLLPAEDGDPPAEEGFPLPAIAAYCDPGYEWPFTGCTPWEGLTVSYLSADETYNQTCVTASTGGTTAGCGLDVPFGSTISASIDPAAIPAGFVLQGEASQTFDIPGGPPDGVFGGPIFVLLPEDDGTDPPTGDLTLTADTAYCEPGYLGPFVGCTPWEGVTVAFESSDAPISTTCVTVATWERTATCGIPVPYGSTITVSIDPATIPAGYALEGSATQTIDIPESEPDGVWGGAAFVLLPESDDTGEEPEADDSASDDDRGAVVSLPSTGTGPVSDPARGSAVAGAVIAAALVAMAGMNVLRRSDR